VVERLVGWLAEMMVITCYAVLVLVLDKVEVCGNSHRWSYREYSFGFHCIALVPASHSDLLR
jgi:hypothetical protein